MTADRIVLSNMRFMGRHGVLERERTEAQRFEVDVEMELDLRTAGRSDDLAETVDYRGVFEDCRTIVETRSYQLIEALAEGIAEAVLARCPAQTEVVVRVRKPQVDLGGPLDHASVEIRRRR